MTRNNLTFSVLTICAIAPLTALAQRDAQDDHAGHIHYINGPRADALIPRPGVELRRGGFALLVIDPQAALVLPELNRENEDYLMLLMPVRLMR